MQKIRNIAENKEDFYSIFKDYINDNDNGENYENDNDDDNDDDDVDNDEMDIFTKMKNIFGK